MENVAITNQERFEQVKDQMKKAGMAFYAKIIICYKKLQTNDYNKYAAAYLL